MKRFAMMLLVTLALLAAAGCAGTETAPTAEPSKSPVSARACDAETETLEKQRQWIEDRLGLCRPQELYDTPWFYSVTDLDHNGRAEVTAAYVYGMGIFTSARYWEGNAEGTALVPCKTHGDEDAPWMDVIQEETPCYHDKATGRYYYVYEKTSSVSETAREHALSALCLYYGWLEVTPLCTAAESYADANMPPVLSCRAADGTEISEEEYRNYADRYFEGMEKSSLNTRWKMAEEAVPGVAAESQTGISLNPDSETLPIGGRALFALQAEEGTDISWRLIAPNGKAYSLTDAMEKNPGLHLKAMEGDILAVGNVPCSLDGWAVQAGLEGQDGSSETSPAYIHVGDFLSAYSSVIEKYRTAKEAGVKDVESRKYDVSELICSDKSIGYAMDDLDGDGIPELIIAGFGTDAAGLKPIADLYTLRDGQPKRLKMGWTRSRPYLTQDHKIYIEGADGADKSIKNIYRLEDGNMIFEEGFLSRWEKEERAIAWFYTRDLDYDFSNDTRISTKEAKEQIAAYESGTYLPPLIRIK